MKISKLGKKSGPPPIKGPMSQGLNSKKVGSVKKKGTKGVKMLQDSPYKRKMIKNRKNNVV